MSERIRKYKSVAESDVPTPTKKLTKRVPKEENVVDEDLAKKMSETSISDEATKEPKKTKKKKNTETNESEISENKTNEDNELPTPVKKKTVKKPISTIQKEEQEQQDEQEQPIEVKPKKSTKSQDSGEGKPRKPKPKETADPVSQDESPSPEEAKKKVKKKVLPKYGEPVCPSKQKKFKMTKSRPKHLFLPKTIKKGMID